MFGKRFIFVLLLAAALSFASCGKAAEPSYESPEGLFDKLCENGVLSREDAVSETLDSGDAFLFRMDISDFDRNVERGITVRRPVDTDGRLLYIFEMRTEDAATLLAEEYYNHYEFPACDNAEKMVILTAGRFALFCKASKGETEAVRSAFRRYSGGKLVFEEEIENRG